MFGSREPNQLGPEQGSTCEIERLPRIISGKTLRLSLPFIPPRSRQIHDFQPKL